MLINLVIIFAFTLTVVQAIYWLVLSLAIFFHRPKTNSFLHPVSLVVCSKNALYNLKQNLPKWKSQKHKDYEVIIVDDYSNSEVSSFLKNDSNIRCVRPEKDILGKKQALFDGIKAANHEAILVTDDDCSPSSHLWISKMQESYNNKNVVLGFGPIYKKISFLNLFSRYETFLTGLQYLSYAILGKAYMGVGRNMLYPKSLFLHEGIEKHKHIISGDDDLFVQAVANQTSFSVNLDPRTFMYSHSADSFSGFIRQKTRHLSTSFHYSLFHKVALSVNPFFQLVFHALIIGLSLLGVLDMVVFLLLFRWFLFFIAFLPSSGKLDSSDLKFFFPILDVCYTIYLFSFSWIILLKKNDKW